MDQDETWHGGRPRPSPNCVKWEPSSLPPKEHSPPIFGRVCCGQTAGWIKMQLGTEVGLGPGHTVLDGDPAPPTTPNFRPIPVVVKRLDESRCHSTEIGLGPGHIVLDGDSAPYSQRSIVPNFRPMSIVAKTVAHLSYC